MIDSITGLDASLAFYGYALAGLVSSFLAILLLSSYRGRLQGGLLSAAAITAAIWGFLLAWGSQSPGLTPLQLFLVEILHDSVWLIFLSALLSGAVGAARYWIVRYGGILLVAGILIVGVGQAIYANYDVRAPGPGGTLVLGSLLTALYALVLIEQIYRNARESQRRGLKYLCLGVGAIFAYDLFLYSNATIEGRISDLFWGVRGIVVAMCVPLIAVAAQRSPSWSVGIFVSRHVVFYTATLFGAGIYLTVVGIAGHYIRVFGEGWGAAAQVVFFAAAIIALFVFLFSDLSRAKLRVFITKHFFQNKYDYREEWLRLINTLTSAEETIPLRKRAMKALAEILDAPAACLWICPQDSATYRCVAGWNMQPSGCAVAADSSLVKFLNSSGWIVDLKEYGSDSSHYEGLELDGSALGIDEAAFIVPLVHDGDLLGFVALTAPASQEPLNFEDRDLLKTAGQQVASYLAQEAATEQLAESRQFEAFNRLTAYLMHDLKNVIAQQSLVVENARKHKSNPAFIDDAMATINSSVTRMRRILEHLQQDSLDQPKERVELGSLVMQAVSQCADRQPVPRTKLTEDRVWVRADKDRLLMALYHAIRNAQDATDADGNVTVSVDIHESDLSVHIVDTGVGMDEAFIRDQLFRPFDSTKGVQGMGMGAYQLRETVRAMGGEVHVNSQPGKGTTVSLELKHAT